MRTRSFAWTLSASAALLLAGCPQPAHQISQDYSPPPGTEPLDTNPHASQNLAGVSSRLSTGTLFQQTTTTSSADGAVTNIEQTPGGSLYEYAYVGDGQGSTWQPDFYIPDDPGSGGGSPPPTPPGGGGGDPPTVRGATVFAGVATGTDYEGIVGCCDATFSASEGSAVSFDSNQNLAELSMPGFALLPDYAIRVAAPGEINQYSGTVSNQILIDWSYTVTTRSVVQSADHFTVIFDVVVFAHSGALTQTGTAVHQVEGTRSANRIQWSSSTNYQIDMHAVATGQPDVLLQTFQNWTLNGSLVQQ
jgi:hypothetical protein